MSGAPELGLLSPKALRALQLHFAKEWRGDTQATAEQLDIPLHIAREWVGQDWFAEALGRRTAGHADADVVKSRLKMLKANVKTREELARFWSAVVDNPEASTEEKLKASKLLADMHRMFATQVEVTGAEKGPIRVHQSSLAERVAMLAAAHADIPEHLR
jgi:hypothetical protein